MKNKILLSAALIALVTSAAYAQQQPQPAQPNNTRPNGAASQEQDPPGLERRPQLPANMTNGATTTMTNAATRMMRDEADTPADQTLLIQIRQSIQPLIQPIPGQPWMPVHFACHQGTVIVIGLVPSHEHKQKILAVVRETPGIVQVVDQLQAADETQRAQGFGQTGFGQDQAATAFDQNLIVQLRQEVQPVLGSGEPWSPVHFVCRSGVVTVTGFVPSEQQKQRVFQIVQQTPGVVQVVNQLQINEQAGSFGSAGSGVMATNQFGANVNSPALLAPGTNQAAFSNNLNSTWVQGSNALGAMTNLAPTSRTNAPNRVYPNQAQPPLPAPPQQ